jgi:hypothetical protein
LQFAQVMTAQAHVVREIARAFEVTKVDVIQFAGKMLFGLQHVEPDREEPRDDRLNFNVESLAHAAN